MLTKGRLAAQEITLAQHHKNRAAVVAMLEAYAEFPPLLKQLSGDPSHCIWGVEEPPRRDGENAQKTGKNGEKVGEIRSKR